jgi:hypothetical protein
MPPTGVGIWVGAPEIGCTASGVGKLPVTAILEFVRNAGKGDPVLYGIGVGKPVPALAVIVPDTGCTASGVGKDPVTATGLAIDTGCVVWKKVPVTG